MTFLLERDDSQSCLNRWLFIQPSEQRTYITNEGVVHTMITTNELMTSTYQILINTAAKIREDHPGLTCVVTSDQRNALELSSDALKSVVNQPIHLMLGISQSQRRIQTLNIDRMVGVTGMLSCRIQRHRRPGQTWSDVPFGDELMTAVNQIRQVDIDADVVVQSSLTDLTADGNQYLHLFRQNRQNTSIDRIEQTDTETIPFGRNFHELSVIGPETFNRLKGHRISQIITINTGMIDDYDGFDVTQFTACLPGKKTAVLNLQTEKMFRFQPWLKTEVINAKIDELRDSYDAVVIATNSVLTLKVANFIAQYANVRIKQISIR